MAQLAWELNIKIEPIHLLRQDPRNEQADLGSRHQDTDNWSVDPWSFQILEEQMGEPFNTDPFTDCNNKRTENFFLLYYSEGTKGIDAFAQVGEFMDLPSSLAASQGTPKNYGLTLPWLGNSTNSLS